MKFQVVLTNLLVHIFTTPSIFHGTTICDHDLKIVEWLDRTDGLLRNVGIYEIMGVATID
jgi:hypothetical protein